MDEYNYITMRDIIPINVITLNILLLTITLAYAVGLAFYMDPEYSYTEETDPSAEETDNSFPGMIATIERLRSAFAVPPDEGVSFF